MLTGVLSLTLTTQLWGQTLPRVVVLATGGTIASTYDEATGALRAALTGEEIVAAVEGLSELARVSVEQVARVTRAFADAGIIRVVNGASPRSPDHNPMIGPAPGLPDHHDR